MPEAVPLQFPTGGINEDAAYAGAPGLVVPRADLCLNVQPYDVHEERNRGGQRPPLEKYFAAAVNGSNPIDRMIQANAALGSDFILVGSQLAIDPFTYSDGDLDTVSSSAYVLRSAGSGQPPIYGAKSAGDTFQVVSNKAEPETAGANTQNCAVGLTNLAPASGGFVIRATFNLKTWNSASTYGQAGFVFRVNQLDFTNSAQDYFLVGIQFDSGTTEKIQVYQVDDRSSVTLLSSTDITGAITTGTDFVLEIRVTSSKVFVFIDGIEKVENTIGTTYSSQLGYGIFAVGLGCNDIDDLELLDSDVPASLRQTNIIIATGGDLYASTDGVAPVVVGGGTGALVSGVKAGMTSHFQTLYTCDGFTSGYNLMPLATKQVADWRAAVTAGALPAGAAGTTSYAISSVNTSTSVITVGSSVSGDIVVGDTIEVSGSSGDRESNDGAHKVTAIDGTFTQLTCGLSTFNNDDAPRGNVQKAEKACRLMALYNGRIWVAGMETDPHGWWACKAGQALDWDYFEANPTVDTAIAGANNKAGKIEDIITALIPLGDDLLIFGGDHSLWRMSGDPGFGGRLDAISRTIGVLQAYSWTWDDKNMLWFLSQEGLYRMDPTGGAPERVSEKRMDAKLAAIDFSSNQILLQYNPQHDGIHIIVQPDTEPASATDHYWYCIRSNGFWRMQYPPSQIPNAMLLFDADDPTDRAVLFGGYDSIIRNVGGTSSTQSDDGTAIDSFVSFPILYPGDPHAQFQVDDMQLTLEKDANGATLDWYREDTPEEVAVSTTSQFSKTLVAGRNLPIRKKLRGAALRFRLRNNTAGERWAYEGGSVLVKGIGRQRKTV